MTTHVYLPGLRIHIQIALEAGGTEQEILEVLELVSTIGIQSERDNYDPSVDDH